MFSGTPVFNISLNTCHKTVATSGGIYRYFISADSNIASSLSRQKLFPEFLISPVIRCGYKKAGQ
ncbi:hypothetical protein CKG00_04110 [Morganella morganii]|uniref:Uncharacterized protein n=1 Tax=Morganella morganii TaxID=582 RepID=A0A433ZU86_MORMO|nr:hypothetical protein CKG00_04110 [Morganella morganii]